MTKNELRCNEIDKNLFEITEDMPEEMKKSRMGVFKSNETSIEDTNCQNEDDRNTKKYNFRPYDQNQSFFLPINTEKFLKEGHPALIISNIVEKLDLTILGCIGELGRIAEQ